MKRYIAFIIAFIFLFSSTGASIHLHYCMGRLAQSSIWGKKDSDRCSKCGMTKKESQKGCCNDDVKLIKLKNEQKDSTEIVFSVLKFKWLATIAPFPVIAIARSFRILDRCLRDHAPPLLTSPLLFKRYGVFLI